MASHPPKANMNRWEHFLLALAGIYGALGVGLGAYRAHGLKHSLLEAGVDAAEIAERFTNLGIAVEYGLIHVVAIIALLATNRKFRSITCLAFACGIFFFSGSLTVGAIWNMAVPSVIPPTGGILLIGGWIWLIAVAWCGPGAKRPGTC